MYWGQGLMFDGASMSKATPELWTEIPNTHRERLDPTAKQGQPLTVAKVDHCTRTITVVGAPAPTKKRARTFHL